MNDDSYFLHESSYVDEGVEVGSGTKIWHFCHVLKGSRIGQNCIIGQNCMVGPDVIIGDRCKFQNNVSIYTGVTLEDECFCGPSCVFTNVYNPRAFVERKERVSPHPREAGSHHRGQCHDRLRDFDRTIRAYRGRGGGKIECADYAVVAGVPARQVGWAVQVRNDAETSDCQ